MQQAKPVNTASPLNQGHHLANGLELWWLALPHLTKSYTWRDLSLRKNDGTLTLFDLSGTALGWASKPRNGGSQVLRMDYNGTGQASQALSSRNVACLSTGSTRFTIAGWGRLSNSTRNVVVGSCDNAGYGPFLINSAGSVSGSSGDVKYGTVVKTADTLWHYYQLVYDGTQADNATRLKLYYDGVQQTLGFGANVIPAVIGAGSGTKFGTGVCTTFSYNTTGDVDDLKVYSRALSETELIALYRESSAGHPNLLNWLPSVRKGSAGGGGAAGRPKNAPLKLTMELEV